MSLIEKRFNDVTMICADLQETLVRFQTVDLGNALHSDVFAVLAV
jgi:hypothetical protein